MSYADSLMAKDERALYRDRQHWLAPVSDSLRPIVLVLVGLAIFFFAMFFTCMLLALFDPVCGTEMPMRCNAETSVCAGKTVCELSPVPRKPTTSP